MASEDINCRCVMVPGLAVGAIPVMPVVTDQPFQVVEPLSDQLAAATPLAPMTPEEIAANLSPDYVGPFDGPEPTLEEILAVTDDELIQAHIARYEKVKDWEPYPEEGFETSQEIEDWAKRNWPDTRWELATMHPDMANPTMREFDKHARMWPGAIAKLEYVGNYENPYAGFDGSSMEGSGSIAWTDRDNRYLAFNPEFYNKPPDEAYNPMNQEAIEKGFTYGTGIEDTIAHEFGHLVHTHLTQDPIRKGMFIPTAARPEDVTVGSIVEDKIKDPKTQLSHYATYAGEEAFAEHYAAWSDGVTGEDLVNRGVDTVTAEYHTGLTHLLDAVNSPEDLDKLYTSIAYTLDEYTDPDKMLLQLGALPRDTPEQQAVIDRAVYDFNKFLQYMGQAPNHNFIDAYEDAHPELRNEEWTPESAVRPLPDGVSALRPVGDEPTDEEIGAMLGIIQQTVAEQKQSKYDQVHLDKNLTPTQGIEDRERWREYPDEDFATIEELTDWASRNWPHTKFDLEGMDIGLANRTFRQWDKHAREWPEITQQLEYVGVYNEGYDGHDAESIITSGSYAWTSDENRYIAFNPDLYSNPDQLERQLAKSHESGFLIGDSVEDITTHEWGHLIHNYLEKGPIRNASVLPVVGGDDQGKIGPAIFQTRYNLYDTSNLSEYSKTHGSEAFAEHYVAHYKGLDPASFDDATETRLTQFNTLMDYVDTPEDREALRWKMTTDLNGFYTDPDNSYISIYNLPTWEPIMTMMGDDRSDEVLRALYDQAKFNQSIGIYYRQESIDQYEARHPEVVGQEWSPDQAMKPGKLPADVPSEVDAITGYPKQTPDVVDADREISSQPDRLAEFRRDQDGNLITPEEGAALRETWTPFPLGGFARTEDVAEWATNNWPHTNFDITNMPVEHANRVFAEWDKQARRWPEITQQVQYVGVYNEPFEGLGDADIMQSNAYAWTHINNRYMAFNPDVFTNLHGAKTEDLDFTLRQAHKVGNLHPDSIEGVVAHEWGHLVNNHLELSPIGSAALVPVVGYGGQGTVGNSTTAVREQSIIHSQLSKYATSNDKEGFAEHYAAWSQGDELDEEHNDSTRQYHENFTRLMDQVDTTDERAALRDRRVYTLGGFAQEPDRSFIMDNDLERDQGGSLSDSTDDSPEVQRGIYDYWKLNQYLGVPTSESDIKRYEDAHPELKDVVWSPELAQVPVSVNSIGGPALLDRPAALLDNQALPEFAWDDPDLEEPGFFDEFGGMMTQQPLPFPEGTDFSVDTPTVEDVDPNRPPQFGAPEAEEEFVEQTTTEEETGFDFDRMYETNDPLPKYDGEVELEAERARLQQEFEAALRDKEEDARAQGIFYEPDPDEWEPFPEGGFKDGIEAEAWASKNWPGTHWDLKNIEPSLLNEAMKEWEKQAQRWPGATTMLKYVGDYSDGEFDDQGRMDFGDANTYAWTARNGRYFAFNPQLWGMNPEEDLRTVLGDSHDRGFLIGGTPADIVAHEWGHVAEAWLQRQTDVYITPYTGDMSQGTALDGSPASAVVNFTEAHPSSGLSEYASYGGPPEAFAEHYTAWSMGYDQRQPTDRPVEEEQSPYLYEGPKPLEEGTDEYNEELAWRRLSTLAYADGFTYLMDKVGTPEARQQWRTRYATRDEIEANGGEVPDGAYGHARDIPPYDESYDEERARAEYELLIMQRALNIYDDAERIQELELLYGWELTGEDWTLNHDYLYDEVYTSRRSFNHGRSDAAYLYLLQASRPTDIPLPGISRRYPEADPLESSRPPEALPRRQRYPLPPRE